MTDLGLKLMTLVVIELLQLNILTFNYTEHTETNKNENY